MLIFDQLRKNDRQLRMLASCVLSGLGVLLLGLWYVQVLSAKRYRTSQVSQSFRTVRIPAIRGKIFDANGTPLAENRPSYNINLYLEELRPSFQAEFSNGLKRYRTAHVQLSRAQRSELGRQTRYQVVGSLIAQVSASLQQPLALNETNFFKHYDQRLYLPMPVLNNLNPQQVAVFMEQAASLPGVDLEVQPERNYPHRSAAAHLIGYLQPDNEVADEETFYNYRMPDFKGATGLEGRFDEQLRGTTGIKSVLVNSLGYRQAENIWTPAEPGQNIYLTIDLAIQKAAEQALRTAPEGADTRGAVVVMDCRTGDLLAVASNPTFDPNDFTPRITTEKWERLNDPKLLPMINRATYGVYQPGSVFKIIVGLAGLEAGAIDPKEIYHGQGYYLLGSGPYARKINDLANHSQPADFDFKKALKESSNAYFINYGLKTGVDRILELGKRLHFGERAGIPTRQDAGGVFATREWQQENIGGWSAGDTANLCIGQGYIAITPLQVAVMIASVANGGKVLWPRLVTRIQPQDPFSNDQPVAFDPGRVRDDLKISKRTLDIVRDAMRGDVEDVDGTGRSGFVPGMGICAKTGTAQITMGRKVVGHSTWFASFAPFENPRYAVVVMVEDGVSGGTTCGPIARQVYLALQKREQMKPAKPESLASSK